MHCGNTSGISSTRWGTNNDEKFFSTKSFSGKELIIQQGTIYKRVIYEIKPRLDSISAAIGQIRSYARFLRYYRWDNGIKSDKLYDPELVLLTLDDNDTYDKMLQSQNICIYHIPPKDVRR